MQRGLIFSDIHDDINYEETKNYYSGDYKLEIRMKIVDGIIHFDDRKSHIKNFEQILNHFYNDQIEFNYDLDWFLKKKENNLDGKEMFYASYLAHKGEATILYGDFEDETNKLIKSTMLFLPKDIDILSTRKIVQILNCLSSREEELFGTALCSEQITDLDFKDKKETFHILKELLKYKKEMEEKICEYATIG